jgi:DNA (cytosine-5)-methyltransferase 1
MPAYYNEIDPYAAQWLRNLIAAGHIAPGVVDERSIEDVHPSDLRGFEQCHFFAGIGVWSLALRRAGWSDDRSVWTGSCPCQPFSSAGQGAGFDDERHLWPAFFHLISQRRPAVVFGEQVASRDADPWIDLVQDDLEGLGYGVAAVPFPSASVGAPHIRDRLYWVANAHGSASRKGRANVRGWPDGGDAQPWAGSRGSSVLDGMADANQHGRTALPLDRRHDAQHHVEPCREPSRLADSDSKQRQSRKPGICNEHEAAGRQQGSTKTSGLCIDSGRPGPTNGRWSAADWLLCRDGKWRPVEPGTFPLVDGAPSRVGRLRAYGNAINAQAAETFIRCVMPSLPE